MVYWLRQMAHDQEVVGSNPDTIYWMKVSSLQEKLKKKFLEEAGVIKFHEILQQIYENLEGWSKIFQKLTFIGQIFPFLAQNFV
jgi:hypothetical protein